MLSFSKNLMLAAVAATGILSLGSIGQTATAAEPPTMVIMAEDYDEESVPRHNRIYTRIFDSLTEELQVAGYKVFDETGVGMAITQPNRVRRRDTELFDVARSITKPPLDLMVVFQIYAAAVKSQYSDVVRPQVRIRGRILNVRTAQAIATFETGGSEVQLAPLPASCDRNCLLETVGAQAKPLAADLATVLDEKLRGFMKARGNSGDLANAPGAASGRCDGVSQGYTVTVDGFSRAELNALEENIAMFSCYGTHRVIRSIGSRSEYWYETRSGSARINRNLREMLEEMNVRATVEMTPNNIRIHRIRTN